MKKLVKLNDGTEVIIRQIRRDDLDRALAFFQRLPEEDRMFLRYDVTKRENVARGIKRVAKGEVKRLVALHGDDIVADGALELEGHSWKEHVGELRLIVARRFQRRGLGTLMARELYLLAAKHQVDELMVRMMRPQVGARKIFRKLGFQEAGVLPDYVKDLHGIRQDMVVMRCDLETLWREMEDLVILSDWRRNR
jgi:L-amino acid N-acyltransferase YncA